MISTIIVAAARRASRRSEIMTVGETSGRDTDKCRLQSLTGNGRLSHGRRKIALRRPGAAYIFPLESVSVFNQPRTITKVTTASVTIKNREKK